MDKKEIILTPEGRQRLVEELEFREGEKHDEIVERIKEARGFGDLSENAEYDAAKEEQSQNESRINEIRQILATAKVVAAGADAHLSVSIGTTVELEDAKGKRVSFTIVGTTETDSLSHKISNESPAGSVLIGHVVGDSVSFSTPSGKVREYTITNITR
ncbi:transcription elongation factor GreA [Olsenella porci]|jgi:transcription elongation factor GreA|uniref:Transcription elongation factor GreA n=1 Tax=Olsenella porci TaxID=2652279 RepID=A0A6N7XBH3_9ACTN|nr:transcription elongation factor GreA [Olsenella porci]MCI1997203.1 transcription elongation factor GreA [Olsenella sp.]MST71763.1 transcription elongation factor GreA [Olsenella porci]